MITRASCILILAGVLIVSVPEFAAAQDPSPTPDPSIVLDPFWDPINGSAAGTGTTTPNGTWSTAVAAWNDASDGTGTVSAWGGTNRAAVFSAGTDATGSYTVTVSGTVKAGSITFEEGAVTLAGTATPSLTISIGVTINSGINGTTTFGSTLGNVVLGGDQSWANNSSQAFNINSGVVADTATRTLTLNGSGPGGSTFSGVLGNGSGTLNLTVNTTGGATTLSGANHAGTISGTETMHTFTASEQTALLNSLDYLNIYSSAFLNGEIRGQIISPVPEPYQYGLIMGLGLLAFTVVRRLKLQAI